jgi:hypothetical protein
MSKKPDFCGYVTRNDVLCSDGRIIRRDAFKDCDGITVPLVYNHDHDHLEAVIGHAELINRPDGVFSNCYLNTDVEYGKLAKALIAHGDITGLSIYANRLKQNGPDVIHGKIREVSLVLAGANPGAFIEPKSVTHSDDGVENVDEAVIYMGENFELYHADEKEKTVAEDKNKKPAEPETEENDDGKSIKEVFETMNEEQKKVVYALVGAAISDQEGGEEEKEDMKHNVFDQNEQQSDVLTHSDLDGIVLDAKESNGSFRESFNIFMKNNDLELVHDGLTSSGFSQDTTQDGNITWLFPEYQIYGPKTPQLLTDDQSWVSSVINGATKLPYSRVRTRYVDIRNVNGNHDDLRARGYQKGQQKDFVGNYNLVRRETDPQTIYVESELERDDVIDITDFDYVQWQYNIDRMQLENELATAIMLGDGRADGTKGKIYPTHIRPIWTDDDMYTIHKDIDIAAAREEVQGTDTASYFSDNFIYTEAMIAAIQDVFIDFMGTGTPDMYIDPWMLNKLMLARDRNGRRIRNTVKELASELNVGTVHRVQQFKNRIRTDSQGNQHKLLAIIGNMKDYGIGSTKGGQITHFTDFDIRFNQLISLLETRLSGANMGLYSFIVIEEPVV